MNDLGEQVPGTVLNLSATPDPKPAVKSTEFYLVLAAAGWIGRVAVNPDATWQQAATCAALGLLVGAYSIGRALAKRPLPPL